MTQQGTIDYLLEQIDGAGKVSARKMFGEYGIFCDGKMAALVCSDELFVKPTTAGGKFIGKPVQKPPYPNAKPCFFISGELWDDADWLTQLIKITTAELLRPTKKPRA